MNLFVRKSFPFLIFGSCLLAVSACSGSEDASEASSSSAVVEEDANIPPTVSSEETVIEAEIIPVSVTETVEDTVETTENAVDSAYAALTGDAAKGRRVFGRCMACHTVQEGQNRVGPSLYGIIGRPAGSVEGFRYSDANKNSSVVWTEEAMFAFLENPQTFMPGTRMIYPGMPSEQDRADVIAYLKPVTE